MSKMRLSISSGVYQQGLAVATEVIDHNLEVRQQVTVPLGVTSEMDLEPGPYLIRCHLPSGPTLSTQTVLPPAGAQALSPAVRAPAGRPRE